MYRNYNNGIERFLEPNNEDYEIALKEINNGHKDSHWIWYIFPQLRGLGKSYMSEFYGIKDLNEAKEYLNHEILGKRLIKITESLSNLDTNNPIQVFGYIDAVKVKSCMTLFYLASEMKNELFKKILDKFYNGDYCKKTIKILNNNEEKLLNKRGVDKNEDNENEKMKDKNEVNENEKMKDKNEDNETEKMKDKNEVNENKEMKDKNEDNETEKKKDKNEVNENKEMKDENKEIINEKKK